jgi:asparagine synthase (glutamine-hydrolysing)
MFRAKSTLQALGRNAVDGYFHTMSILRDEQREALYSPAFRRRLAGYRAVETFRRHAARAQVADPLSLVQYLDLKTYLVGDINTKVDRASMAHSLEVREPLMDHELVEWMGTLPSEFKMRGSMGKILLKKAHEPHLPNDVLYRPKMGFAVPLARWFRGPLRERVRDALLAGPMLDSGMFNPATIRQIVDQHQAGTRDFGTAIWTMLMFDAFLRCTMGQTRMTVAA